MMVSGLLFVVCAGICWVGIGITVSVCASRRWNYDLVQGIGYAGTVLLCMGIILCRNLSGLSDVHVLQAFLLSCAAGVFNYFTFVLAAKAMREGPNGLVWGILQSGMIGSFLLGICFFGEKATPLRLAGLALILGGMFAMGAGKDSGGVQSTGSTGKRWMIPAFGAFFCVMVTHCCNALPSFLPELSGAIPNVFRTCGIFAGGLLAFFLFTMPALIRKKAGICRGEWIMGAALLVLNGLSSLFLFYNGLNRLSAAGCGVLGYPIAVGICVVGFALFSLLFLKEKISLLSWSGLAAVSIGIVTITLG